MFYLFIQSSSSIQPEQHIILRVIHSVSFPADFGHYSSGMRKIVFKVEANQTKLRSTLSQENLDSVMLISVESDILNRVSLAKVVDKLASTSKELKRFLALVFGI